jgi:hypothetical protein
VVSTHYCGIFSLLLILRFYFQPCKPKNWNFKSSLCFIDMARNALEINWRVGVHVIKWLKVLSLDSRITSMNLLSFGYKQQSQWPYVDHIFLYNKLFLNLWLYLICSMHILISLQWLRMELYWDYDRDRTHTQLVVKHGLEM